jgi:hypothetical protein
VIKSLCRNMTSRVDGLEAFVELASKTVPRKSPISADAIAIHVC